MKSPSSPWGSRACAALSLSILVVASGCNLLSGVEDLRVNHLGVGGAGGEGLSGSGNSGGGSTSATGNGGSASATTGNGGSGATGTSTSTGTGVTCSPACGANQYCEAATTTCVCNPGYVKQGNGCKAAPPGDPTTHTEQEVCDHWVKGHQITEQSPLTSSGAECDAGSLKQGAIVDTLVRIEAFRWLSGLGPVSDDAGLNAGAQKCANLESWWNFNNGGSPHFPPAGSKCYTAEGAAAAGQSNIAWGSGHPAQAIDQFMEDNGNATTMGHRRWILNPPLDPVGIGYWQGGGQFGNAECLSVFGGSGNGPSPPWVAMPNQGFVPVEIANWTWTFHGSIGGIANAQISVLRVDDNTPLAVNVQTLQQGFAQEAISWTASGWQAQPGKTYRVTVSGVGGGDVVYDVKPITCN